jgi:hypothetical protein
MKLNNPMKALIATVLALFLVWNASAWEMPEPVMSLKPMLGAQRPGMLLPLPDRPIAPVVPPQDANSDPPWDWTEDVEYRLYITLADEATVHLPYFDPMGPAGAALHTGGADVDIYPEDGWVLVARDFGTETHEVTLPYFILYNKYRGILRLFFYHTFSAPFTYGLVKLEQQVSEKAAALFTFGEATYFVDDFDENLSQEAIVLLGYRQWCYADFVILGYDPALPTDATLVFTLSGVEETELQVSGEFNLTQVIEQASISGKRDQLGAFETAYKKYMSTTKALEDLGKTLEKKKGFFHEFLGPLLNSDFARAVPYLSAAAGFVKALIGGKPRQVIPMKFQEVWSYLGH